MTADDFSYRSQDVDYLGFLEAQLRDLQGIGTLAYELIQNADDARDESGRPQSSWLSFNVTDDALIVTNDGAFRPVDFQRLQRIAGGGKREEAGTTGAFGIGFTAVYQVTDAPEIYSGGRHWVIRPEAPPSERIRERKVTTEGTQIRLPWAFDGSSQVRRILRLEAIQSHQLDAFAAAIAEAIETAALFLRQLQVLVVKRNDNLIRRIERRLGADQTIFLEDNAGRMATWLLFRGDFAAEAEQLRAEYPWQIENTRASQVRLALPVAGLGEPGRLFAGLPTDTTSPLPFHVNADFFPTTDRKRIHFDGGYQAEWNRAAVHSAAGLVAENFHTLPLQLGPVHLWQLLQKMDETQRLVEQGRLPGAFSAFWQALLPLLPLQPTLYTAQGQWALPGEVRLPPRLTRAEVIPLLEQLNIPVAHPDLAPYFTLMRRPEIGAVEVTIEDIVNALVRTGLERPTPLYQAPPPWSTLEAWQELWQLVETVLGEQPPAEREAGRQTLDRAALVLTDTMTLERLNHVYRGTPETKALFPQVAWLHEAAPLDAFPGRYVRSFGVRQAVERLAEMPVDQLEAEWRVGRLDLPRLFRWFESQQIEIFADDPALQPAIRRLPLCPISGELRPLAELYIPGGFEDPLRVAGIVDLEAIGGRRQFLRDLGVRELDFDTYIEREMPRALAQNPDLPSDARQRLVQLLAERLGEISDDEALQAQMSQLPLIACMDGSFRAATSVYSSREVVELLGDQAHVAEPVESRAVQALHRWLGVREEPTAEDVVQALLAVSQQWQAKRLDPSTLDAVQRRWQKLSGLLEEGLATPETLAPLSAERTIPNRDGVLTQPPCLFFADRPDLAAQFIGLGGYLLSPDEQWARAAGAAGVRPLSQAVEVEVAATGATSAPALQKRIAGRRILIDRLLLTEIKADQDELDTGFLDGLRVMKARQLQIQYRLQIGPKILYTELATVPAKFDARTNTLYLEKDQATNGQEQIAWAAVARELAMVIRGGSAVGSLAMGIREVLAAETFTQAAQVLDELGFS